MGLACTKNTDAIATDPCNASAKFAELSFQLIPHFSPVNEVTEAWSDQHATNYPMNER
jgi:hypothetical protein